MKNPAYTPEKTRSKQRALCFLSSYDLCNIVSVSDCRYSLEQFNTCFSNVNATIIPSSVPLCRQHKSMMFNTLSGSNCAACGLYLILKRRKYSCSQLDIENAYSKLQLEKDEVSITKESFLCFTCYSVAKRDMPVIISLDELEAILLSDTSTDMAHSSTALNKVCAEICHLGHNDVFFVTENNTTQTNESLSSKKHIMFS